MQTNQTFAVASVNPPIEESIGKLFLSKKKNMLREFQSGDSCGEHVLDLLVTENGTWRRSGTRSTWSSTNWTCQEHPGGEWKLGHPASLVPLVQYDSDYKLGKNEQYTAGINLKFQLFGLALPGCNDFFNQRSHTLSLFSIECNSKCPIAD